MLARGESGVRWTSSESFWYPDYLCPSAWLDHAPFAWWLMGILRPRSFVELGTHHGYSYFAFCQAVQRLKIKTRCFAVDTWKGDEHAGLYGPEVFVAVEQHNAAHYFAFSRLIRSTFDEALAHFSDRSVDLLHVDGRHFYEDVKHDFSQWCPKLSERAVVLFHDTNVRERGFGVFRLWEELRREFPGFEFLHGHGLGVLGYGQQVPTDLGALFAASEDAATTEQIRAIYDRLGAGIKADFDASQARTQLAEQVKSHEARIGAQEAELETQRKNAAESAARLMGERDKAKVDAAELASKLKGMEAHVAELKANLERSDTHAAELAASLAQRDRDLAVHTQGNATIEASLSWRLMEPFREMYRAVRRVPASRFGIRLRAAWRHPGRSRKRKAYRSNRMAEYAAANPTRVRPESKTEARLRALIRHPFSRNRRRAYRQLLRSGPPPTPLPPASRRTMASLIDFSSLSVSAIVPNYNHARFLQERLASIVEQRLPVSEIIILDDASTDDSRNVITRFTADITIPVRTVFNDRNSGSVFGQWAKGISLATGDLIWICESDDTCDRGFLEALVPYFDDQSIMLAFGRIDFIEEDGSPRAGMNQYMESAAAGYWHEPRVESARTWFRGPFGVRNIIPNAGGCIFRRQQIEAELLGELLSYKVCGDWYLYSRLAHGGRIAYDPTARAYFRQHRANTSVLSFKNETYHEEHIQIGRALRQHYGIGPETLQKMLHHVYDHHRRVFGKAAALDFQKRHYLSQILSERPTVRHVLIAILGFQTGGGEMFPIHLANAISRRGHDVSVLIALQSPVNKHIRRLLSPGIPVFTKTFVEKIGINNFIEECGVDLIHTHNVGLDKWLYWLSPKIKTPYVVTHHGSYECELISEELTAWLLSNVDHWIYIADKNLAFADEFPRKGAAFTKLPNALPLFEGQFPFSREDLGIHPDAFIFGLASRAVRAKGWDIAISAVTMLQERAKRPIHLILCGDGDDLEVLQAASRGKHGIHFLGYQETIQAFYRFCDCCVLPTRFAGESYPLTIIEAILAGIPIIATDMDEIRSILRIETEPMGLTVPPNANDSIFTQGVLRAMESMLDPTLYSRLRAAVAKHQGDFSMDRLTNDYLTIYQRVISGE